MGRGGFDGIIGAMLLPGKGFLAAGTTSTNGVGPFSSNHGGNDVWVMRLDSMGNVLTNYLHGGTGSEGMDYRMRIYAAGNGLYTIGARTNSYVGGDIEAHYGDNDFWFLTVDTNGALVNSKVFGGSSGDDLYSTNMYNNSVALEGGLTQSNDFDVEDYHGEGDGWLIKIGNFNLVGEINTVNNLVTIFPNPLHESATIQMAESIFYEVANFEVYNNYGELVRVFKGVKYNNSFCMDGFVTGLYLFRLTSKSNEVLAAGSFVVE